MITGAGEDVITGDDVMTGAGEDAMTAEIGADALLVV